MNITTLARIWLTRELRPFTFRNDNDERFHAETDGLGLYIHIPFCRSICGFCPYCKTLYDEQLCERYIDALLGEIHLVCNHGTGRKTATSLYIGGGTPALAAHRMKEIIDALSEHFSITEGIGIELHPSNVNVPLLHLLKDAGVTKISIGVQSFLGKYQKILGRTPVRPECLYAALKEVPFETISIDLIFALPKQTVEDLRSDVETAVAAGANHIAMYPFIDFACTPSETNAMPKKEKRALLDAISQYCLGKGWIRNSIWTFACREGASYSSMTRTNFLGFGCSAASALVTNKVPDGAHQFKINTFSVQEYCRRIKEGRLPTSLTLHFSLRQRMLYYLFWTAYSTVIKEKNFEDAFGTPLEDAFGLELWLARKAGFFTKQGGTLRLTQKGIFFFHHYEQYYTLAYIDKMWGILRHEPFPSEITL